MREGFQHQAQTQTWKTSSITLCLVPTLRLSQNGWLHQKSENPVDLAVGVIGTYRHYKVAIPRSGQKMILENGAQKHIYARKHKLYNAL